MWMRVAKWARQFFQTFFFKQHHTWKRKWIKRKITTKSGKKLYEAVRIFSVLYDKQDKYFKEKNKKELAWEDKAKEADLLNGK